MKKTNMLKLTYYWLLWGLVLGFSPICFAQDWDSTCEDTPGPAAPEPRALMASPWTTNTGGDLDQYLFRYDGDGAVDFNIVIDESIAQSTVFLTLSTWDVDNPLPSSSSLLAEIDKAYINGHYLGILTGASDTWSINTFTVPTAYLNAPGTNAVRVDIDTLATGYWAVKVDYGTISLTGSYQSGVSLVGCTDRPDDTDGNGKYDWLNIDVTVNATAGGSFNLNGALYSAGGSEIVWASTTKTLAAGNNTVTLQFNGEDINCRLANGPYTLRDVTVYNTSDPNIRAFTPQLCSTGSYTYGQFETCTSTCPLVISTSPIDGATGVSTSTTVSATFNVAMDEGTLNTSTFLLVPSSSSTPVGGTVSYDSTTKTARFSPIGALASNTVYNATLTTGVQSQDDCALASPYTWSFTTIGVTGAPPVISSTASTPSTVSNDGTASVLFGAYVSDPDGSGDIASVVIDLASLGGSTSQLMYDDGTHGDTVAGNGIYSFRTSVPSSTLLGQKSFPVTATDRAGLTGSSSIRLSVIAQIIDTVAPGATRTHEVANPFTGQTLTIECVLTASRVRQTCATTLTVKRPDLSIYSREEILTQTSTLTIPNAAAGIWTYEVTTACTQSISYSISTSASGTGVITGMVTASGSQENLTGVEISTNTGGIALSISGYYVLVTPAGQCTVTASGYGYKSCSQSGVVVTSGGEVTANLTLEPLGAIYFPHIASNSIWETEIAIVNPSATEAVTGTLRPFGDTGTAVSTNLPVTLAPHGRKEVTISQSFANPDTIGYMLFESGSSAVKGYTKFYRSGLFRAAIPAAGALNAGDVYLTHVTSDPNWWTGVSLLNADSQPKNVTFGFGNVTSITRWIPAHEHQKFLVSDLFGGQTPAGISSAVITNGSGVIGLELFSSANQLEGIPLTDNTATSLYYPHVPSNSTWWTGIVVYNPLATACTLTITPYRADGTVLTPTTRSLGGKEKLSVLVSALGLSANTGWVAISSTTPITGFALIGTANWNQVGGFYGIGAKKQEGIFAKRERSGGWTYLSLVNTEASAAQVTLTAYDDTGGQVATTSFTLNAHAKAENSAEGFFPTQGISTATYLAYSSDKELVGLQLNGSSDNTLLDGLPGL